MVIQIPLRSDLPAYEYQCLIEQVTYTLSVAYNARSGRWTLDIKDINANPIVTGIPLLSSWDLLRQYKNIANLPRGELMMIDTGGGNKIADTSDIGDRVILLYQEAS